MYESVIEKTGMQSAWEALTNVELLVGDELEELEARKKYYQDQLATVNNEIRTIKKTLDIVREEMKATGPV